MTEPVPEAIADFRYAFSLDRDEHILGYCRAFAGEPARDIPSVVSPGNLLVVLAAVLSEFLANLLAAFWGHHSPSGKRRHPSFRFGRLVVTNKNVVFYCPSVAEPGLIFFPVPALQDITVHSRVVFQLVTCRVQAGEITRMWIDGEPTATTQTFGLWSKSSAKKVMALIRKARGQ